MSIFYLDGKTFEARSGETVLDALLRHEYPASYSCRKGRCRSCLLKYVGGDLALMAQRGLEIEYKQEGLIFACQCIPSHGLALETGNSEQLYIAAPIIAKTFLSENVIKLVLDVSGPKRYLAGQSVNLRLNNGIGRTFAIAKAQDNTLEFHIRRKRNGKFSDWLFYHANNGDELFLQGPWGHCHYYPGLPDDILVLIGGGTGLGAVVGIAEEALERGHRGEIYLYHYGRNLDDLYQHKYLLQRMLMHKTFFYQACVGAESEKSQVDGKRVRLADPIELVAGRHQFSRQFRVFICGEPKMVLRGQERIFLAGVPIERIHVLSFDYRELRKRPRTWG
ncbi:2Fe-2S iron-sulfur cluster binding domain-containing protein [Shewanella sp. SNU WT4]|uniref:2Fe-2S iron-sulfur cluster-binding protein n=1 Tax=Shewanella sp. SNU WT4 TaxID=2590015 RepID=UPI00112A28DE|nr:2Fe-2S iron-sulfur cluster-binding protein [Shewanella sp. SNU WT4]QDF67357.1 2Fe-2S iron-sulfur cluster binding domain-containing protein [Shewanella sp. SNU WT4]